MKHPDFLLWMLLFPIACSIEGAIRYRWCKVTEHDEDTETKTSLFMVCLYFGVAWALW